MKRTDTQDEAWAEAQKHMPNQMETILATLWGIRGMTRDQICEATGILPQSACGALNKLVKDGKLFDVGRAVNVRGRNVIVYGVEA
jgi:predicted ArsR family transcriptional regulator